jgi:two-component system sensor histidine kinase/response regulator
VLKFHFSTPEGRYSEETWNKKMNDHDNATILLVDDIPDNIRVLGKILKRKGYSFAIATNGKETFDLLDQQIPDLILLDIMLPDTDGFDICKKLKADEKTKEIPVIFLSAKRELEDKLRGFETGAVDYITKPFEEVEVIARVSAQVRLKKSADMIREYSSALEKANTAKDKLFSVISHDLRGPVGSVHTVLELLTQNVFNEDEKEEFLKDAERSVKNILELLETLLHWARSQQDRIEYKPEHIDMAEIIQENMSLLRRAAKNKSIQLYAEICEPVYAYADRDTMTAVLRNLISNAVKFTPESGTISISAISGENHIEITVKDSGIGISRENVKKLFAIDRTVVRQGTNKEKGTGLGLVICKEFIEKNRGNIRVETEIGKGSSFIVTLPRENP